MLEKKKKKCTHVKVKISQFANIKIPKKEKKNCDLRKILVFTNDLFFVAMCSLLWVQAT